MIQISNDMIVYPGQYFTTGGGSDTNNLALTSSALVVTVATTNDKLTGMIPDYEEDGAICYVINSGAGGAKNLVIPHNSASSTVGFRFDLTPFTTLTLGPQQTQLFFYSPEGAVPGWKPYIAGTFT